ncbi:MAG: hypothetical protein COA96_08785 [SAR86 cluster bacterium]|uniref:CopC domain-containing protein n=1 Tax=SAR86 cluster bacterium TaxID=2030880 RepID=A0A2A5B0Z4_9GAMM|nr:MAG: hypothetical protein COA96_08785 [SAR86 cluster bacterium]
MKLSTAFRSLICAGFAFLVSTSTFAHTALETATPGDGAIVNQGPAHINLVFNGPVKLLKLELMGVGHEMPTSFEVNSEPQAAYVIETPGMHPGAFTVNWAVIGADGHAVTNSYSFVVDPDASASHSGHEAGEGHEHGDAGHGDAAHGDAGHGHGDANPH